jgi:MraZ protein
MGRNAHDAVFRGATDIALDAKGRLAVPARYRDRLATRCGGQLICTIEKKRCLLLYPLPDWEEIERKLMRLPSLNPRASRLQELMLGHAAELELDGHGRVLIPRELRDFAGLARDVTLVGQGNKFAIWDAARWKERRDAWLEAEEDGADLPDELGSLTL